MIATGDYVKLWTSSAKTKGETFIIRIEFRGVLGSNLGEILHSKVCEADWGGTVTSSKGVDFQVLKPTLPEICRKMKRATQVIYPKEAAYILLHLGVKPGSKIIECGTGSGGLTTFLATYVGDDGHVYSYEIKEEHQTIALKNITNFGLADRVTFFLKDVEQEGFAQNDADGVFLDTKEPWLLFEAAHKALIPGARIGVLVPTMNQLIEVCEKLTSTGFVDIMILEALERNYKSNPKRMRPEDKMVAHTGYMIFASSCNLVPNTHEAASLEENIEEDE